MKTDNFRGQILERVVPQKLDLIDRKILYLLSKNARLSNTAIAKFLKLNREVVSYRIKVLQEKGVINGFLTLINVRKLGFSVHGVFIKLKTLISESSVIGDLLILKEVTTIHNCSGRFDIYIQITARSLEEFESVLNPILKKHSLLIQEYVILNMVREDFTERNLLMEDYPKDIAALDQMKEYKGSSFQKEFDQRKENNKVVLLDQKDKKILEILKHDGRATIREISSQLDSSPASVENKIRKMITEGIITRFTTTISFTHFGWQWNKLFLQLKDYDEQKLLTYFKMHPNILWYTKYVGPWNYVISVFTENHAKFHDTLNQFRSEFSENINSFDSTIIFNQFKLDQRID